MYIRYKLQIKTSQFFPKRTQHNFFLLFIVSYHFEYRLVWSSTKNFKKTSGPKISGRNIIKYLTKPFQQVVSKKRLKQDLCQYFFIQPSHPQLQPCWAYQTGAMPSSSLIGLDAIHIHYLKGTGPLGLALNPSSYPLIHFKPK